MQINVDGKRNGYCMYMAVAGRNLLPQSPDIPKTPFYKYLRPFVRVLSNKVRVLVRYLLYYYYTAERDSFSVPGVSRFPFPLW